MKKSIPFLVLTFLLLITIGSCKKKDKEPSGTCSFTINGKEWKGDKQVSTWQSETKFSFTYGKGINFEEGYDYATYDQSLNFNLVDKKLGRQTIPIIKFLDISDLTEDSAPFVLFSTFTQQGCTGCEMFYVGGTDVENNWIEVTKQEDNFKKIWGKFSLTMVKDSVDCFLARYPNTIEVRNGSFYLEM